MKSILYKILGFELNKSWLAAISTVCFFALLIPLIRLAFYAAPWYDDYSYGLYVRGFIDEQGLFPGLWNGIEYTVVMFWHAWQGTFASTFMMSLVPISFGEQYYVIGIIGIFLFFTLSILIFVKVCLSNMLKADLSSQIIIAVIVATALIELIYTAQQNIYWYNAAVHYTFMHGCLFFLIAVSVKLLYSETYPKRIALIIASIILSIFCGGSNYATSLIGIIVIFLITALNLLRRKKNGLLLLPGLLAYAISFYINVSAPGNSKRAALSEEGDGVFQSIWHSFGAALTEFWNFTGIVMIIILIMLVPVIWNMVNDAKFDFPLPGLVLLFSFCVYASGFTSSFYAGGTAGLSRTWTVIKFTLQILLIVNEIYFLGWLNRKMRKSGKKIKKIPHYLLFYLVAAVSVFIVFKATPDQIGNFSSWGAYHYVKSGEAHNFRQQYLRRVEQLNNSGPVVEFEPLDYKPWFLRAKDYSTDYWAEPNQFLAGWYGKEKVFVRE
jgi:hypothetical protein